MWYVIMLLYRSPWNSTLNENKETNIKKQNVGELLYYGLGNMEFIIFLLSLVVGYE